jgi:hypothetical protein
VNNQAKAVLWIGLILIAVQLIQQWNTIKSIIFTPGAAAGGAGFTLPFNPALIPFSTIAAPGAVPTPPKAQTPAVSVGKRLP